MQKGRPRAAFLFVAPTGNGTRSGSAGRWPAVAGSRPAAGSTRRSTPCVDGVRALACGQGSDPKAIGLIPPGMAGTGGSAGRWPAVAGSRPAAGSTRRSTPCVDGAESLPAARDPTPKPSASSRLAWPAQGGSAGRWPAIAGSRPAAGSTRRSTPCVDGVRALACGQGSDPKAIGLIPPGMAGTGGSAGRWPAVAGSRPVAGSTRSSTPCVDGV